jgi:hypothetical protein
MIGVADCGNGLRELYPNSSELRKRINYFKYNFMKVDYLQLMTLPTFRS